MKYYMILVDVFANYDSEVLSGIGVKIITSSTWLNAWERVKYLGYSIDDVALREVPKGTKIQKNRTLKFKM